MVEVVDVIRPDELMLVAAAANIELTNLVWALLWLLLHLVLHLFLDLLRMEEGSSLAAEVLVLFSS